MFNNLRSVCSAEMWLRIEVAGILDDSLREYKIVYIVQIGNSVTVGRDRVSWIMRARMMPCRLNNKSWILMFVPCRLSNKSWILMFMPNACKSAPYQSAVCSSESVLVAAGICPIYLNRH